jgi:putative N6-adenine-specific DNA methylase
MASLGHVVQTAQETAVEINGTTTDAMKLNLHLRTANHVLLLLNDFPCMTPEDLYRHVSFVEWEKLLSPDGYLSVIAGGDSRAINNWVFVSQKVKDAIVDRIAEVAGRRPNAGPEKSAFVVNCYWVKDHCWLYLNTSGQKLSDRGYRRIPHKAPMRETLAAGVLMATGYDGSQPLVNPMCGSGTLAIEAGLIAAGRPPGLLRSNFGFMHALDFDDTAWQTIRRQAHKAKGGTSVRPIIATDIDDRAIRAAEQNAKTAGVDHLIQFRQCDFADTQIPSESGHVLLNPEYGQRLGEIGELEQTYARIGDFFKQKCPGWTGWIFTGNPTLAKKVGLRASRRIPFFNGPIECRLLKYELYTGTREKYAEEQ